MADKRYQVFVSSTYEDLQDERREVMQALLELDCIPAGMELFPAADETQWSLIRRVIDDCDYYIVIVAGRYGSTNKEGMSYTEMEYRYALDQGKPIIAFLHREPSTLQAKRTEASPTGREKLEAFRGLCQQKMVKHWLSASELGSVVSRSLVRLTKDRPGIGWVRADSAPDQEILEQLVKKNRRIEELEQLIATTRTQAPAGSEKLASGEEEYKVEISFATHDASKPYGDRDESWTTTRTITWNDLFAAVSPLMLDEASETSVRAQLAALITDRFSAGIGKEKNIKGKDTGNFRISDSSFQTIKVQFTALGLIRRSVRTRSVKDRATYWSLTPYGEQQMIQLRAIPKGVA
jgi:hypothetical protein